MKLVNASSRFHRIVKKMDRYREFGGADVESDQQALLLDEEAILGVYAGDRVNQNLVFTNNAFVYFDGAVSAYRSIEYTEIIDVVFPRPTSGATSLTLKLSDSSAVSVDVVGQKGSSRDVFEMGRFFMRVVEDINQLSTS